MSIQDERNEIIQEHIPLLIKHLTGFEDDDINKPLCEQFAWNIMKNHRNLSTNSHEVRRLIKGTQERFRLENFEEYAEYLGQLCEAIVQHPVCVDHYEVDVHWSLLDFLFALAYNPTGALKRNENKIIIKPLLKDNNTQEKENLTYWKNILKDDFINVTAYSDNDSDLSDWSDVAENFTAYDSDSTEITNDKDVIKFSDPLYKDIKPPEKRDCYIPFNSSCDTNALLQQQIQHSWWLPKLNNQCQDFVESSYMESNFCLLYNRFLTENSNNLIKFCAPKIISEQNLMRELLWLFHDPHQSTIFKFDEKYKIKNPHNYSLCSVTADGLTEYLEDQFVPYIQMMHTLKNFHKSIYNGSPPCTIECYAANLNLHLAPIWDQLLHYERRLLLEEDFHINTLINMRRTLNDAFNQLQYLYDIHQKVYLDYVEYPAHISSAFLLAGLESSYQIENQPTKANFLISLLIATMKVFCVIVDTWWSEGRLDDWENEYIVERISRFDQTVRVRDYCTNDKQSGARIPDHISRTIFDSALFQLMLDHSLEAGHTLNLLYEINRIGDLRNSCSLIEDKLYNIFIRDFIKQVRTFQKSANTNASHVSNAKGQEKDSYSEKDESTTRSTDESNINSESLISNITTRDQFLLMTFGLYGSSNVIEDELQQSNNTTSNALSILQQLEGSSSHDEYFLPLEEIFTQTLSKILTERIAFANSFVMSLYRDEFSILRHLKNIRQILLLEASDIMHIFYSKLFKQIERGQNWASPFLLTMQLDDIICAKYPDMSSLFRVEIKSTSPDTNLIFDAVDKLVINYNLKLELTHVISVKDMEAYNKIFRFLLKIKWGLIILEELPFPRSHKRRPPFVPFEMIDLIMRRLEQLRFWMMYSIQSVHSHLMTYVLQSMGDQLDAKINNCENLKEMEMVHASYLNTACEHCFLVENLGAIKLGVEQLLSLTCILRLEWLSCVTYIESNNPLALASDDSTDGEFLNSNYITNSQVGAMEFTYIRCHQYLANILNKEVYLNKRDFLTGLNAAFNTSTPY